MDNEEKPSSLVTPNEFNRLLCQGMATRTPKLMVDNQISCVASVGVCRRFMVTDGETPLAPFISRNRNWVHSISSKRGRGQMEFPLIKHSWIGLVCCCVRFGIRSIYNVLEEEEENWRKGPFHRLVCSGGINLAANCQAKPSNETLDRSFSNKTAISGIYHHSMVKNKKLQVHV